MVVGEWSLALGGRGKAALPASQVGFLKDPWGYHGDIIGDIYGDV